MGAVEVAAGQAAGEQRHVDHHHLAVEQELGDHRVPRAHHLAHRAHQMLAEPGPQVLARHLWPLPPQPVQFQQPAERRSPPLRAHHASPHTQRGQPAQLGPRPLAGLARTGSRAISSSMGTAGSSRHGESRTVRRGPAPAVVDLLHRSARAHLAEVDQCRAGRVRERLRSAHRPPARRRRRPAARPCSRRSARRAAPARAAAGGPASAVRRPPVPGRPAPPAAAAARAGRPTATTSAARRGSGTGSRRRTARASRPQAGPSAAEGGLVGDEFGDEVRATGGPRRAQRVGGGHRWPCASTATAGPGTRAGSTRSGAGRRPGRTSSARAPSSPPALAPTSAVTPADGEAGSPRPHRAGEREESDVRGGLGGVGVPGERAGDRVGHGGGPGRVHGGGGDGHHRGVRRGRRAHAGAQGTSPAPRPAPWASPSTATWVATRPQAWAKPSAVAVSAPSPGTATT